MNRSSKLTIAGGLAVVLLAGGAGTFARWYDEADVTDETISTGSLALSVENGEWLINSLTDNTPTVEFTPESDTIVPGDVVTFSADITPELVGTNLEATLSANLDKTGLDAEHIVTSEEYEEALASGGDLDKIVVDVELLNAAGEDVSVLTEADSGAAYTANITIQFPEFANSIDAPDVDGAPASTSEMWGEFMQDKTIELTNISLELIQNDR